MQIERVLFEIFGELVTEKCAIPFESLHITVNQLKFGNGLVFHLVPVELEFPSECIQNVNGPNIVSEIPGHQKYFVFQETFAQVDSLEQITADLALLFIGRVR